MDDSIYSRLLLHNNRFLKIAMILQLDQLSPAKTYFQMIQTVVPRPIAWVLTENETGNYNLAPFSYFNAVCSDPALIMLSVGVKPDGSSKDTCHNIVERKFFTVHIADESTMEALNQSSATLARNHSELDDLVISLTSFESSVLPRISECKIAYACELYEIHKIGNTPQSVIYGKVNSIYIDDAITSVSDKGRIKVHAEKLRPISRLGTDEYMQAGRVISLPRPR